MDLAEVEKFEAPVKVLKLSAAIRIGAKIRKQSRNGYFDSKGRSCALGAAFEAIFGRPTQSLTDDSLFHEFQDRFPEIQAGSLGREIVRLNDSGKTREQIADWLESQGY